jgi:hypothetical protein
MQKFPPGRALGAACLLLLALSPWRGALAEDAAIQSQPLGDLSSFRTIAVDTLAIINTGNLRRAKARLKDLETNWDAAEAKLRPRNPERWRILDKAVDAALVQLRADRPQALASKDAFQNLLALIGPIKAQTSYLENLRRSNRPGFRLPTSSPPPRNCRSAQACST